MKKKSRLNVKMSLQSSAGVPPPPLIPGGLNVNNVQVSRSTKLKGVAVVPNATTSTVSTPVFGAMGAQTGVTAPTGTLIFDTSDSFLKFFDGSVWRTVTSA
jgi:hypothetical protein